MKQILLIKDPDYELPFENVCQYAEAVQERLGSSVAVLPMWPHGEMELIGDKRKMKLTIKTVRSLLDDLEAELSAGGEVDADK